MASVGISGGRGGQLGGGGGGAATTAARSYHCYECDRTVTILVTSQLICPNCNGVVLEEFETPPPSPPLMESSSAALIEPNVFFPGYADSDSDGELSDLPPPPPPPLPFITTTPRTAHHHHYQGSSQSTIRGISSPPPSQRPIFPNWNSFFSPEEIRHNQYNGVDSEFYRLPPPPPPPIPGIFSQLPPPPPSAPPLLNSTGEFSDSEFEIGISDFHLQSPPLTTTTASHLPPPSSNWDYFFPFVPEPDESSSNRHSSVRSVQMPILLPPPPPWFRPDQPPAEEGLPNRKMTEELVFEWESCQCAVCIDGFELNQIVKQMPCKHIFHSACISPWLDNHKSCPVCRYKL